MHVNFGSMTPLRGTIGGLLIGMASVVLLASIGRIAGISGIVSGALLRAESGERPWRLMFLTGLVAGGGVSRFYLGHPLPMDGIGSTPVLVAAGLLVGFGTRLGSGCTSGHGVNGLARFSKRSLVATLTFMAAGVATVFVARHLL